MLGVVDVELGSYGHGLSLARVASRWGSASARLVRRRPSLDAESSSAAILVACDGCLGPHRRLLDWDHVSGVGIDGEWLGTWPQNKPVGKRRTYRVTSDLVARGAKTGLRKLEATYRTNTGAWRGFGGLTQYVGGTDHAAVSKFFDTVDDSVAHNRAAR